MLRPPLETLQIGASARHPEHDEDLHATIEQLIQERNAARAERTEAIAQRDQMVTQTYMQETQIKELMYNLEVANSQIIGVQKQMAEVNCTFIKFVFTEAFLGLLDNFCSLGCDTPSIDRMYSLSQKVFCWILFKCRSTCAQWGLCTNVIVRTKLPPRPVILRVEQGDKPKCLPGHSILDTMMKCTQAPLIQNWTKMQTKERESRPAERRGST